MPERMKKDALLETILTTHGQIEAIIKDLSHLQLGKRTSSEEWSIKDIIAHIAWYETEMIKVLETRSLQGSDWWEQPLNKRNGLIHQTFLKETVESVMENETTVFHRLITLLTRINEDDLNDPAAFADMPVDWQPWSVIASNTNEHYLDHIQQIKDCLKAKLKG